MKKLIFLLCGFFIWQSALSQVVVDKNNNASQFFRDLTGGVYTRIQDRSYSGGVTDTSDYIPVRDHKTVYVSLMTKDSATILIDYSVSVDGANWSAYTVKDSLSNATSDNGFKSVDFTSTVLGFNYARFRFRTSALAFALGTTTPTYSAIWTLKKE